MKIHNLVALVMAGGRGERLWPRSTSSTPKYLLKFGKKDTMLEETIDRLCSFVSLKKIFIVTSKENVNSIKKFLPGFPVSNIIREPFPRNTASCIGLASVFIKKKFPDAVVSVFPADHIIRGERRFSNTVNLGAFWAEKENAIVTIGIKPDRPETGFGYIEVGEKLAQKRGISVHKAERFVEKPNLKKAKSFVSSGKYLWNGGMFIFKIEEVFRAFKLFMPELYKGLMEIESYLDKVDRDKVIRRVYKQINSISFDYGIMEKTHNRLVVVTDCFWNDIGSWISLEELYTKDQNGNISIGDTLLLNTINSIFVSDRGLIAAIGIKDMVIVSTKNATIVFPKDKAQEVKQVVESIRKKYSFRKYL